MSSLAKMQKKAIAIATGIITEMDDTQIERFIPFLECISFTDAAESEAEDDEEKPAKGKVGKKSAKKDEDEEEDDTEEEEEDEEEDDDDKKKPVKGKAGKKPAKKDEDEEEEDDDSEEEADEEADEEEEDDEEEKKPAKGKAGKKPAKKDEDEEDDSESDESDEEPDYSSMKIAALKKLSDERGMPTKTLIKGKDDKKAAKAIVTALEAYDTNKASFAKMKLDKLLKLVEKNEVEYAKPRGKAGDDKKKDAAIAALLAAGVEA